jgi:chemotaxis-related protein WspD
LLRLVHCRNCPVYAAAAIQLLDRPVIADYRREWSEHYAAERKLTAPAKTSVVIFRISSEWLALPTQAFQEVAERRVMHTLPHRRRDLVLGLVNVRGELLVCISLGQWLGLAEPGAGRKPETGNPKLEIQFPLSPFQLSALPRADRLLVANWEGHRIAFPVEEVHGIHRVYWEQLREPPATIAKSMHTYSRGVFSWRDHTVGFLDAEVLFSMLNRSLS